MDDTTPITEAGGRRVLLRVPAEKAAALQSMNDLCEELAATRGQRYADAVLSALVEAGTSGTLTVDTPADEAVAWLLARVAAILNPVDSDA